MASITQFTPSTPRRDLMIMGIFAVVVLTAPIWATPIGANYPDLLQRFAIFGIFAIGYNLLFGLTGYLSFGHAAFLGVGSYAGIWIFKLLTMNVLLAMLFGILVAAVFALAIGYVALRRAGIYFAILTLAFAQMSYNLAYSVLTPITNGETGLSLSPDDPRAIDALFGVVHGGDPVPSLFGIEITGYAAFYFCAVMLILAFWVSLKIFRSPFGLKLLAIKSNQNRMRFTGYNTRPYVLAVFIISGMYAGLAGSLMAVTDPLAGAERMQWTASGEVVLMTILGGAGTLVGPILGAAVIKYAENIFSAVNDRGLAELFGFLPEPVTDILVGVAGLFVGDGWHLTLGLLFMVVVTFLPGGMMEGLRRIAGLVTRRQPDRSAPDAQAVTQPSE